MDNLEPLRGKKAARYRPSLPIESKGQNIGYPGNRKGRKRSKT
jgi:hypothetical protein